MYLLVNAHVHVKMVIVIIEYKGNCRPTRQNGTLYYVQLVISLEERLAHRN